ncbi:hypothetical protein ATANTOWER_024493 [Ataeniobius toweri]|uniref:N-acetylglucosaminyldiphosphodolichol N-acetylglucosaminyltransferase n=1 Tax=Ataeniobius toweri TaxID=208326 RepID=A0ABU7BIF6_9TELE|nr:hypothetical protein [Ataeniobius toweri]
MSYSYKPQVVKPLPVICSSPSSSSSSPPSPSRVPATPHLPPAAHAQTRPVALTISAAAPWLVNELGEPLCTVVTPPPYSYDLGGSDLPRDCRVLQYYYNLGVQWYHQSCWQQQQVYAPTSPDPAYPYQHYPSYLSQEPPPHGESLQYGFTSGLLLSGKKEVLETCSGQRCSKGLEAKLMTFSQFILQMFWSKEGIQEVSGDPVRGDKHLALIQK